VKQPELRKDLKRNKLNFIKSRKLIVAKLESGLYIVYRRALRYDEFRDDERRSYFVGKRGEPATRIDSFEEDREGSR
jgi:hypothetical protein